MSVERVVPVWPPSRRLRSARAYGRATRGLHALNEVDHNQAEQNRGQQDPQGVQGAYWSRLLWHLSLMPREACWYAGANWA